MSRKAAGRTARQAQRIPVEGQGRLHVHVRAVRAPGGTDQPEGAPAPPPSGNAALCPSCVALGPVDACPLCPKT